MTPSRSMTVNTPSRGSRAVGRHGRRFLSSDDLANPSIQDAISALENVVRRLGVGTAKRVYAHATTTAWLRVEKEMLGERRRVPARRCLAWLFGTRHREQPPCPYHVAGEGAMDHVVQSFREAGKFIVSQPYDLSWDEMVALVEFCSKHGLEAHVDPVSTHFPGATLGIEIGTSESWRRLHAWIRSGRAPRRRAARSKTNGVEVKVP